MQDSEHEGIVIIATTFNMELTSSSFATLPVMPTEVLRFSSASPGE
jgi:hypothetical protein